MPKSLFKKVWSAHTARTLANGQTQPIIGTHLIHEVTSPQAARQSKPASLRILSRPSFSHCAGGSMCLARNHDKLIGDQLCASSSNRNFKGRQGYTTGRTLRMSPALVAGAAVTGSDADADADAREVFAFTAN